MELVYISNKEMEQKLVISIRLYILQIAHPCSYPLFFFDKVKIILVGCSYP